MKSTLSNLITSIFLTLTSMVALAAPPTPINPADYTGPIRIACVGDSITVGVGAETGKSYPSQLQAILGDKWQVKHFGVSGRTLLKKGDLPYWKEDAFTQAQDFQPDVVVILLGTNDTKPQNWVYHDEFYADYKDLVETFKNLKSKPRIFICHPCPAPEPGISVVVETSIKLEIPLIDQVAAEENVGVIDLHTPMVDKANLFTSDHVHPNTAGAGMMAQIVAEALMGKTANSTP